MVNPNIGRVHCSNLLGHFNEILFMRTVKTGITLDGYLGIDREEIPITFWVILGLTAKISWTSVKIASMDKMS